MFKKLALILLIFISAEAFAQSKIFNMSKTQIDSLLTKVSKKNITITDKIKLYSEMFLEMPYNLTCTGDGPFALYDTKPLVNFDETNCMVYCEHVLALSISDSWENFFNNLQQIRYKDGIIGMKTRNHYTMADWLPENSWILDDISEKIGGKFTKTLTRTISHKNFFKDKDITDLRYVKEDRKITINYVPFDALLKVKDRVKNGDILSLLFKKLDNIFSAHMLMCIEKDGKKYIRESAMSTMTTFDTPYDEWVEKYVGSKRYAGLAFMRVKEKLNKPGKIILPWEIDDLK